MGIFRVPIPRNEPVLNYVPGSMERAGIQKALAELKTQQIEIPMIIDGREVKTDTRIEICSPHNHKQVLGYYYQGGEKEVKMAVESAVEAQKAWAHFPWEHRAAIFLKAADLLSGRYRYLMNAAAMLAHSKNIFQAEIDAVCELADFYRFNAFYMQQIYDIQPENAPQIWNRLDHRPLEGFIFAVTPFNFISINGNLPTAPAMLGNVSVWKPASTAIYTSHFLMKIFREAGLPAGVINLIFARGASIGEAVLKNKHLAGIHFTGSTGVFQMMWKTIGENIASYRCYPRIVGETGGKDFIFAHNSANPAEVATAITRGAFEYQGQKCSAASRAYLPQSRWPETKQILVKQVGELKMGDPEDFTNFINAVIDESAYRSIVAYIDYARESKDAEIICGGKYDESKGWFIEPTVVVTTDPHFKLMEEEIFGPVVTLYIYDDNKYAETLHLCDQTSPYALTGAIFATDRQAIALAERTLRNAAGNFYINDKPTGAVVGQQPFGGGRASGTNDKAGGIQNMLRWASPRSIKENFVPPVDYKYPFMGK
ncbi:MAG: L-glutamate gamma-semialdehyde dehydrogenase [candidate division Zixibacteria bacterium]|nr:L-glutamate gamma-semialdehyde dehydrogenase [candidate division Zixibacteria bacterium]MDD5426781.1 L-glutamate gamma-semialdehyde dehydrogenase [candidate division Zixibacteria bacterium]